MPWLALVATIAASDVVFACHDPETPKMAVSVPFCLALNDPPPVAPVLSIMIFPYAVESFAWIMLDGAVNPTPK